MTVAFDLQVRQATARINADVTAVLDMASAEFVLSVRRRTPVDTGRLQNGWMAIPTSPFSVEIVNDVPYAEHVEFGTSRMAPRGMARTTMAEWPRIVNRAVARMR